MKLKKKLLQKKKKKIKQLQVTALDEIRKIIN